MAKRKKTYDPKKALVKSGLYAVRTTRKRIPAGPSAAVLSRAAGKEIETAKRMAAIEAYAKEHGITVAKAMIHLM